QETSRASANRCSSFAHRFNTSRQFCHNFFCALDHVTNFRHATNVIENIEQTGGFEIHEFRWTGQSFCQSCDCSVTDRADVAQFLCQDHVRTDFSQQLLVDCVNGAVTAQRAADPVIDFTAR